MNTAEIAHLTSVLRTEGLTAGLALLNKRVPHRYTAVFRFRDGAMHNIAIYDKAGEVTPEGFAVVPFTDSFCQFVLRDDGFQTSDTAADTRLAGHKYQGVLLSYHGVPLMSNHGDLYGTMCHFDFASLPLEDNEFEYFQKAARVVPSFVPQ